MSHCPSSEELQAFVAESLSPDRFEQICEHVESCETCQTLLAELTKTELSEIEFGSSSDTSSNGTQPADSDLHSESFSIDDLQGSELNVASAGFLKKLAQQDPETLYDATWKDILDPPEAPGELGRLSSYSVVSEIGSGGMGVVFRARDLNLDREVALKTIRPSLSIQANLQKRHGLVNRFRREARLASALNHPNVVTIYEIGEHNGLVFIAMEYVDGCTLREQMKRNRLSVQECLNVSSQIADALAAAHARNTLHRDLKPENVMIRDDGLVKVLDFGLARAATPNPAEGKVEDGDSLSVAGAVIGTVSYMSPEQARGDSLEISSDIFSFGILLYTILIGEHPFAYGSKTEILAAILDRAPKPFGDSGLPGPLQQLILQCLSKDPNQRPKASGLCSNLKRLQQEESLATTVPARTASSAPSSLDHSDSTLRSSLPREVTHASDLIDRPVRYAQSGEVNIAWQAIGEGPLDIVFVMGWVSHLDWFWKDPNFASFLNRLSEFGRVILFDKRGTGLSDKVPLHELPTLEDRMDDVRAVMDAAECDKAVLFGVSEGGPMCALFAATYPDKTVALVMNGSYARRLWAPDYPWGPTAEQREHFLQEIRDHWGGPIGIEERAPSKAEDPEFRAWWANYLRMGASPGAAVALTQMNAEIDIRGVLPNIQTPTLVIHRLEDRCLRVDEGRYLAESIPGAKFVELPGADHLPFVGDSNAILEEIEEFLTGKRQESVEIDRVLATVLCIQVEEPDRLDAFQRQVECQAELFRGDNLRVAGALIHLTFDGPVRAVRAAQSLMHIGLRLEINIRYGVSLGVCDVSRSQVAGPAVEMATQVAQKAPIAAVLVSEDVKNLTSGSGLEFVAISSISDNAGDAISIYQLIA
ncbi:MAG: alpha/beta fold hydrolase [Planctomycetota bacterium]